MYLTKLKDLASKRIVVLGDVLIDRYRVLRPERISPEAPVLIYRPVREYEVPGGAANVSNNLLSLGVKPDNLTLCGLFGTAWPHGLVDCQIRTPPLSIRKTTVKERIVTDRQQVLRIDDQEGLPVVADDLVALLSLIEAPIRAADCVVMSDYNHGVMQKVLVKAAADLAREKGIPIVVDSKAPDTIRKYPLTTVLLPNNKEVRRFDEVESQFSDGEVAKFLLVKMSLEVVAMTMGPKGILFVPVKGPNACRPILYPPLEDETEDEVIDVTGAGDTVTAAVAAGLSVGMSYDEAIKMANIAAGVVVQKKGVATATKQEITKASERSTRRS